MSTPNLEKLAKDIAYNHSEALGDYTGPDLEAQSAIYLAREIFKALTTTRDSALEEAAKVAESDDYKMFLTHNDIMDSDLVADRIGKIRKQARKEVATKIRTLKT